MPEDLEQATVYDDDPDAYVPRTVTSTAGLPLDFPALVAVDGGDYDLAALWQGDVGPERTLHIPTAGFSLGQHQLYLQVPLGNNVDLGWVNVITR